MPDEVNPYDFGDPDERWVTDDPTDEESMNKARIKCDHLKWEADRVALKQSGCGRPSSPIAAGSPVNLATICGITSYYSNYGGTGAGNSREGFYMDVWLNGQKLIAGTNGRYREKNPAGTGATTITMTVDLDTTDDIEVQVRRL